VEEIEVLFVCCLLSMVKNRKAVTNAITTHIDEESEEILKMLPTSLKFIYFSQLSSIFVISLY